VLDVVDSSVVESPLGPQLTILRMPAINRYLNDDFMVFSLNFDAKKYT
jgi:hypothetical protein